MAPPPEPSRARRARPPGTAASCRVSEPGSQPRQPSGRESDLDVHAGREMVEPLERVDRLRRWLVDVDQPLVGADLEVLTRVLVLERRADHAVDVLLGGQRHGTGDGRAGARGRLDDLLGRRLDRRVVVGLQTYSNLVLGNRCQRVFSPRKGKPRVQGPPPKRSYLSRKS